jgi:hypothetical protein
MSYQVNAAVLPQNSTVSTRGSLDHGAGAPSLRQKTGRFHQPPISAESVLRSFNTRSFKREQPGNPDLMLRFISEAIAQNGPVAFVMYWGKGPRAELAEPEFKCLDYLASLVDRVRQAYAPGARVTLIFTDTHAELNGHSAQSISSYFADLTTGARERGFETGLLSTLMQTVDIGSTIDASQVTLPEELLPKLCASAAKWYRGDGTIEQGAIRYYQTNMIEKQVMERAFPRSIFMTFNGSGLRNLFPDGLPIFYMYSLRHGVCDKPWFLPADFLSRTAPANPQRLELVHST